MVSVDVELFKDSAAFMFASRCWGNTKKIKSTEIKTGADPAWVKSHKILMASVEYEAIKKFIASTRTWCDSRSSPSYFRKGIQIVRLDMVDEFEKQLGAFKKQLGEEMVPALEKVWEDRIKEAEGKLKELFNPRDYPAKIELKYRFDIDWNFIGFTVPDNLPKELFEAEKARVEARWKEAEEMILFGLRESFGGLVDHAIDRLTVKPGEKPKIFKASTIENISEFIELFSAKNIMNDGELAKLVDKAKKVLVGADPEALRQNVDQRKDLVGKFETVKTELDKLLIERPSRAFSLEEEEEGK